MKHPILTLLTVALCAAGLQAETLDAVLARMDQASRTTRSISANFTRTEFVAVFGDTTKATGSMNLRRDGGKTQGVVRFTTPDVFMMHFPGGNKVEKLLPAAKLLEVYDVGKRGSMIDEYLLLGFANSTKDLRADYDITLGGEETVGGKKATRIVLIPKNKEVREEYFATVEMWIPEGGSSAVQVKLTKPSSKAKADYFLFEYSDVKVNPELPASAFQLVIPAGVQRKNIKF